MRQPLTMAEGKEGDRWEGREEGRGWWRGVSDGDRRPTGVGRVGGFVRRGAQVTIDYLTADQKCSSKVR